MDIYLLDDNLNKIHIIDDYQSVIWADRYNELGDCEVVVNASISNIEKVHQSVYISREDSDMTCRIEKLELKTDVENGDYLIITGIDVKKILNQRIVWNQTNFKGLVENYIRKLINDNAINPTIVNRKISKLILDESAGFTETINEQVTYDNLGEKIQQLCKTYNWGYKVYVNDENKFVFKLFMGTDRSDYVIFSDEYENLISTDYFNDNTKISTIALVAGEGEGTKRIRQTSGIDTSELNRYELFVDAKDVSKIIRYEELLIAYPGGRQVTIDGIVYYQVDGVNIAKLTIEDEEVKEAELTSAIYNNALISRGLEKLAELNSIQSFEGSIEPMYTFIYKKDYLLGDVVTIENKYGISLEARIVEAIEVEDTNGYSVELKFEYLGTNEEPMTITYLTTENNKFIVTEDNEKLITEK